MTPRMARNGILLALVSCAVGCGSAASDSLSGARGAQVSPSSTPAPSIAVASSDVTETSAPTAVSEVSPPPPTAQTNGVAPAQAVGSCSADQVRATVVDRDSLMSNRKIEVRLTNISSAACVLPNYPSVSGITQGGTVTPLNAEHGTYFGDPTPVKSFDAGVTESFYLAGFDACVEALPYGKSDWSGFEIAMSGGSVTTFDAAFDTRCGVWLSQFGNPDPDPVPDPGAHPTG